MRVLTSLLALALVAAAGSAAAEPAPGAELRRLVDQFHDRTGARLVFESRALPDGTWYDRMPELSAGRRLAAARILVAEARMYPDGWLGAIGLRTVGVFDALVSDRGDGFRPYDRAHRGYLFYGMWNGADAMVAAYYTDGQLPLTFHHEVFHHVDGSAAGAGDRQTAFAADDARFAAAVDGRRRYPALAVSSADRGALSRRAGDPLDGAVGDYATKSAGEDQAETARWLMSHLATGLWQAAARPELAGSQRILHVLATYQAAGTAAAPAPDPAWWVDVALGRDPRAARAPHDFAGDVEAGYRELVARIAPAGEPRFVVWGREEADGGNPTLRADVARFTQVAVRVAAAGRRRGAGAAQLSAAGARLHGLLDRYRGFIAARWSISAGTARVFADTGRAIDRALPPPAAAAPAPVNRYLSRVDAAISDRAWRAAIRAVQPATVKMGGGSGVNLAADGRILTAAHVVDEVGRKITVAFPDGRSFEGVCTYLDADLDLAVVELRGARRLPWAPIAAAAPEVGDPVAVIGQPGTRTPGGEPTHYRPWHVSTGVIRGFRSGSRTGEQHLGRTKHDAWTYWGHSGSPLFDSGGAIVALHNSWDSRTAMRHAVAWEAIVAFLDANRVPHRRR